MMAADGEPLKLAGFREECERLAPLETFDPAAFNGTDDVPQKLCDFVLSLALIYNDFKDAIYAHVALAEAKPVGIGPRTRVSGGLSGGQLHAFRAVVGLLHELFELIRKNEDVLAHDFFVTLLRHVRPRSREAWQALVDVARDATPKDKLGKQLLLIRNKVFFHYDPAAISRGYAHHFLGPERQDSRAYLSRGDSMRGTRFFFADAAALGYLRSISGSDRIGDLTGELAEIVDTINHGLMLIVGTFIQRRGFLFRQETEG